MKTAYLTIDDSPSTRMRERVDFLAERDIPAVWFSIGSLIRERPEPVIHAIHQGFVIGNHSLTHPHFSELTAAEARHEIADTDAIIDWIYERAGRPRPPRYFRFPYGDKGDDWQGEDAPPEQRRLRAEIQAYLRGAGYVNLEWPDVTYAGFPRDDVDWLWTYDSLDWAVGLPEYADLGVTTIDEMVARMDRDDPDNGFGLNTAGSAEIVLAHDHDTPDDRFEREIEGYLAKGLVFSTPPRRTP